MDYIHKKNKSNLKKNFIQNAKNLKFNLNDDTKKPINNIKVSQNRRNALSAYDNIENEMNKAYIFKLLKKFPASRTVQDIKKIAEFISDNHKYFSNLKKEQGISKLEYIAKICRLEFVKKGSNIIEFGDIGDKFYVVMEGAVEIFKPNFIEIKETPRNFLKLLNDIKDKEGESKKYKRIKNKNSQLLAKFEKQINNEGREGNEENIYNQFENLDKEQTFYDEIEEKMGDYGIDFYFGDVALITNTQRNATVKAKKDCYLLSIIINDYNKVILEFQKKQFSIEIENFLNTYSFFRNFENDKIVKLFNCFTKIELFNGDYLYKQNMDSNSIYVIYSGSFISYSFVSFPWINDYINYIDYSEKNLIEFLINKKNVKIDELINVIREFQESNKSKMNETKKHEKIYKIDKNHPMDNLYTLKNDEEKLNSPDYIFKLNLKVINYKEVLGLEEAFEFKKRFCCYKCISDKAELREIKITDLIKIILGMPAKNLYDLLSIIKERKKLLKSQIIKSLEYLDKKLIVNFDSRYENLMKSNESKDLNERTAILFSTLKVKGYKTSIQDLLDNQILSFPHEENPTPISLLKKIKRRNKSSENLLNNFCKKKSTFNEFKFNTKKSNIKLIKTGLIKNNYLNITSQNNTTNNINSIKSMETNFFTPISSNKFGKNTLMPLNFKSSFFGAIKNDIKNSFQRKSIESIKNQSMDKKLNNKLVLKKNRIFPLLSENEHIKNNKNNSEMKSLRINDRNKLKNIKGFFSSKEKEYKGLFNIFNHFDKNFYLGGQFSKKLKREFKSRYKFD